MSNNVNNRNTLLDTLRFAADKVMEIKRSTAVVGEKTELDGALALPVSKLSIGFAGGGADVTDKHRRKNPAAAGAGLTETPVAFLVVKDGQVRVLAVPGSGETSHPDLAQNLINGAVKLLNKKQKSP